MAAIGFLTLELHISHSRSLKDKRQVVRSLKDRLRSRFNVSVAEIEFQSTLRRATIGVVAISGSRSYVEGLLDRVESEAGSWLGRDLESAWVEFL